MKERFDNVFTAALFHARNKHAVRLVSETYLSIRDKTVFFPHRSRNRDLAFVADLHTKTLRVPI
jgi:hypothetical protein